MAPPKILILTALRNEAKAIKAAIPDWKSPKLEFLTVGLRASRLPDLSSFKPLQCVILAGLAGGLDPNLKIGDTIIDCHPSLPIPSVISRRGIIFTAQQMASTPDQKRALFAETGAACVDMEQSAVKAAVLALSVPFIGIRSVSDTAEDALDPMILHWIDEVGTPRPAVIARDMILRPRSWGIARKLARDSKLALRTLGNAVADVVNQIAET